MSATLQIAGNALEVVSDTDAVDGNAERAPSAPERAAGPFGGLSASDAARRANASRREKRTEREAAAELDRLSVLARAGVVAARDLTYSEQSAILRAMIEKAKQGHVQHARFVLDWLVKLGPSDQGDGSTEHTDPSEWTPAQRASARAELLQSLSRAPSEGVESSESPA